MAEYSLGKAEGEIVLTYKGTAAVAAAERDVAGLGKSSSKTDALLSKTGRTAGLAGLAIAGGFALAINSAANFDQRMSAIGAVTGATGEQMDKMRAKALQLGKDTKFSATDAAMAMEELGKAGLTIPDIMNGAADATVALAAAGEVELPRAAEIASNAMNMFNLSAADMPHVADLLAGAANASAVSVDELAMSLSQAGAVANTVGLNIDDTTAAIGLLGNAGIKGSDAGTSLKTMLLNLQPTTKKQIALFKELGIVTKDGSNQFFDAQGNIKSMAKISGVLHKSLEGMTKQQKLATLETMFGSDAIRASAVFADQGAKGFNKFSDAMGKVSAADVAAKRMDNLKGDIEQLKGSLETMGITIGSILIPALRTMTEGITSAFNAFLNLGSGTQTAIVAITGVVGVILLIISAIVKYIQMTKVLNAALVATKFEFIATWAAALGPILLIIAAVAAIGIALIILWKKSETFRNIVLAVWGAIQAAALAVASWFMGTLVPMLAAAWNAIKASLSAVAGFFVAVWNGIKAAATAIWGAITGAVSAGVNAILAVVTTVVGAILAFWRAGWALFGPIITAVFNLIKAIVVLQLTIMLGLIKVTLLAIKTVFTAVWNAIKAVTSTVWNGIKAVVSSVANAVKAVVSAAWNAIKAATSAVWGVIKSVVTTEVNGIRAVVSAVFNAVKGIVTTIWHGIDAIIGDKIRSAANKVSNGIARIKGFFAGAIGWLVSAGGDIIRGLINGITNMVPALLDKVTGIVSSVTGKVKSLFKIGSPSKVMAEIGKDVGRGLAVGIGQSASDIASAAKSMAEHATAAIAEALKKGDVSPKAADKLKGVLKTQIDALNTYATQREKITERLKAAKSALEEAIKVRDDFAKSVADSAANFANITSLTEKDSAGNDVTPSADGLIALMAARRDAILKYRATLAQLLATGLNQQTYQELLAAGVETGQAYADSLLQGGPASINAINGIQRDVSTAAGGLGTDAATELYQAGVDAAQGLVDGLRSKQGEITALMKDIARKIVRMIKRTLGIKSPSRVMIEQARQMMQGLVVGIDGAAGDVMRSMKNAVSPLPDALTGLTTPGVRAASVAASAASQAQDAAPSVPLIGTQNVWYPRAEPASQAAVRERTRSAALGSVA